MPHYMAELLLKERPVLVIGGGQVARRKLTGLLTCGARITVVAPELDPQVAAWIQQGRLSLRQERFTPPLLALTPRPVLVFAVTGSAEKNRAIAHLCAQQGLLCNSADDATVSGFLVPAVVRRGPVAVAVGTEGQSPALSRLLKERIESWLEPGWQDLALLFGYMRAEVKNRIPKTASRRNFWREISLAADRENRFAAGDNETWFRHRLAENSDDPV